MRACIIGILTAVVVLSFACTEIPPTTAPTATMIPEPSPTAGIRRSFTNGIFLVGVDIAPGIYITTGEECLWRRLSGLSGEGHHFIAGSVTHGPTYVEVMESDVAFESVFCDAGWALLERE